MSVVKRKSRNIKQFGILKIKRRKYKNVLIISLNGDMDNTNSWNILKYFMEITKEMTEGMIIDCSRLKYANSLATDVLLNINKYIREKGYKLKLASLTESVREIMEIIGMNTLMDIYPSVNVAIESFEKNDDYAGRLQYDNDCCDCFP